MVVRSIDVSLVRIVVNHSGMVRAVHFWFRVRKLRSSGWIMKSIKMHSRVFIDWLNVSLLLGTIPFVCNFVMSWNNHSLVMVNARHNNWVHLNSGRYDSVMLNSSGVNWSSMGISVGVTRVAVEVQWVDPLARVICCFTVSWMSIWMSGVSMSRGRVCMAMGVRVSGVSGVVVGHNNSMVSVVCGSIVCMSVDLVARSMDVTSVRILFGGN